MQPANRAPLSVARPEPWPAAPRRLTLASGPGLWLLALGLGLLLYFPTLRNSWAYDDIDYINQAAVALAGKSGFWETVFRPQGEHIVAGFRLLLFASLKLFGVRALPFRLLVLAAHAASAAFLGLLARRYSDSRAAAVATALLYVGACGLSSMWVWFPSGSSLPLAMALLTGASLLLAGDGSRGRWRVRLLAGGAIALALLTESTLVPMVALPVLIDEVERRRAGARRWSIGAFGAGCLLAAAGVAAVASWLYTHTFGPLVSVSFLHGAPRAVFLLLTAPFRLVFPGIPIVASDPGRRTAVLGCILGLAVAAPVGALLLTLWRKGAPRLAALALGTALGPLGWLVLVGLGRWRSTFWELYDADRYYFPLLVPLSLLAGAVVATVRPRLLAWPRRQRLAVAALLLLALGSELVLHRRAMIGRIPFSVYAAHGRRFEQLARLADRLERAAAELPPGAPALTLPDAPLWFPDVHNGYLGTAVVLEVIARGGGRMRLGSGQVGARDAAVLNPVLEAWAREIGEPLPYLAIDASGRLTDAHIVRFADFRSGAQDVAVVSGFYPWEGTFRWMEKRGELRVTLLSPRLVFDLAAPVTELRRAGVGDVAVEVTVVDEAIGWAVTLGTLRVARDGPQLYRLDATPFLGRLGNGRPVHLVLTADRTWKPAQILAGSRDPRDLSVMVLAAGCE